MDYQSQMVAVFQYAKGYLLSDRKLWERDVLTPAGVGREGDVMPQLVRG